MTHNPHHHENSIESTAKADAKALQSAGDNVSQHGAAMVKLRQDAADIHKHDGAAGEQKFWDAMKKATADKHLPGLFLHDANGHVDSVVADHKKAYESPTVSPGLQRGDGPYQAFKRQGMSDEAATANANKVMAETGRKEFNRAEHFTVNKNGSVTCHTDDKDHPDNFKEVTYREGKVTNQMEHVADGKGGYTETTTDEAGNWLGTKQRTDLGSGKYTEDTEWQDGSTAHKIGEQGKYTEWQHNQDGGVTSTTEMCRDENGQDVVWVTPTDPKQAITKTTPDGVYSYSNGSYKGDGKEWFNPADPSQPATMTTDQGVTTYGKTWHDGKMVDATWYKPNNPSPTDKPTLAVPGGYVYGG